MTSVDDVWRFLWFTVGRLCRWFVYWGLSWSWAVVCLLGRGRRRFVAWLRLVDRLRRSICRSWWSIRRLLGSRRLVSWLGGLRLAVHWPLGGGCCGSSRSGGRFVDRSCSAGLPVLWCGGSDGDWSWGWWGRDVHRVRVRLILLLAGRL